ncbi:hypothetical protein NO932_11480 [Pelagibacterium sp. 26DY04]|uniref:hypothetical protein n=1 Tax=Pelagibacterium sp. 26DY04 TaxID=2967130 RepID=UPI00281604D2|nr:hypothetical protein [Pelagibacterium sp. 26DY04]WMT85548.1 hypothetical protein NO932_11480 [Pelagibacterium sp. 26DY04]
MAKLRTLGDIRDAGLDMIAVCHNVSCRHTRQVDLGKLIKAVGEMQSLLPIKGQSHFSERMRCPECKHRGMFLWVEAPKEPNPHFSSALAFRVVQEDRSGFRPMGEVARACNKEVAQAAFEVAEAIYPQSRIEMHWHRQVLQSSHIKPVAGGKRAGER